VSGPMFTAASEKYSGVYSNCVTVVCEINVLGPARATTVIYAWLSF
jgi:hypothetical protein